MLLQITEKLTTIRVRHQFSRGLRWAAICLTLAAMVGSGLLVLQRAGIVDGGSAPWMLVLYATAIGLSAGMLWPTSWISVARGVDAACGLKDRSATAVHFATREFRTPIQQLQVEDALRYLAKIDARTAAPVQLPKFAIPGFCMLALMVAIALVPRPPVEIAELPEALPVVLEQAQLLEDTMLDELEQLVEENKDRDLEELAQELKETLEELKQPDVDQKEALAKLSEMQQTIAEALQQMDVEQIDAQLEQLAEALQAAEATQAASQSLEAGQYEQAAEELEKIEVSTMSRKEREAVAANLAKLSKKLGEGKQGQLSDAISEMAQGLENESESQCKSGTCKAAGVCRSQGVKKKIGECLNCQLNRLAECKGSCQGQCDKPGNKVAKSDSPSENWGLGASNKPFGDEKTKLDSTRREENLTGVAGEGPSERETLSTPEARQDAARSYQEKYAEYRKQVEEVLDSEPLPLGHRQTVRTYFESIRPENGQAEE